MKEYILSEYDTPFSALENVIGELIRCKDCKWFSKGTVMGKHQCMAKKYLFDEVEEQDYCSRAERKEE